MNKIQNIDIATVEALHDLLVDKHGYNPEFITLKNARVLIDKLYKIHIEQDFTVKNFTSTYKREK